MFCIGTVINGINVSKYEAIENNTEARAKSYTTIDSATLTFCYLVTICSFFLIMH